jgi:hypothetical protein
MVLCQGILSWDLSSVPLARSQKSTSIICKVSGRALGRAKHATMLVTLRQLILFIDVIYNEAAKLRCLPGRSGGVPAGQWRARATPASASAAKCLQSDTQRSWRSQRLAVCWQTLGAIPVAERPISPYPFCKRASVAGGP